MIPWQKEGEIYSVKGGERMDTRWSKCAYQVAMKAAVEEPAARRRWDGQNLWDYENMRTESTRFTAAQDEELRRCCAEARVTRYTLISYLLQTWIAAWKRYGRAAD